MSAPKHILLRIWHKDKHTGELRLSRNTGIWTLDRWGKHRLELMEKYGDKTDEMFVIARGGLKRLMLLQKTLSRLDSA